MSKKIPLGKSGMFAIVDDEDFEMLSQFKWYAGKDSRTDTHYAIRNASGSGSPRMHRLIMKVNGSKVHVDHINLDGLDNRRCNLRVCTQSQNAYNGKKYKSRRDKKMSSQHKGVCWDSQSGKWLACGYMNNKNINLGRFDKEIDAARAYNKFAKKHYGEFARLNDV